MRIDTAYIAEYGRWRDQLFAFPAPITLMYGPNEAGKSTLMSYLRFMLFGPAPRAKVDGWKGPMTGGRLEVRDAAGNRYRLERYMASGARVSGELGDRVGEVAESWFHEQVMGGLHGELYRQLFAFGLDELQQLQLLESDEVNSYLYTAGLGLRPSVIVAAERKLQAEMDRLYRPRGKTQVLAMALEQQEEVRQKLAAWRGGADRYEALHREWVASEARIRELEAEVGGLRERERWLELCRTAHPHWLSRQELLRELEALPEVLQVPPDGLARLEQLLTKRAELEEKQHALEWKRKPLTEQLERRAANEALAAMHPVLADGWEAWVIGRGRARLLAELEAERARHEEELERLLRLVDRYWTVEELQAFPLSAGEREQVRRAKSALEQADHAVQEARRELREAERRCGEHEQYVRDLAHQQDEHRRAAMQIWGLHDVVEGPAEALGRLTPWIEQLEQVVELESELKRLEAQRADFAGVSDSGAPASRWMENMPLMIGGVLQVAVPAVFLWSSHTTAAWISFVLLAAANAGWGAARRKRGSVSVPAALQQAVSRTEQREHDCREMLDSLYSRLHRTGAQLGQRETAAAGSGSLELGRLEASMILARYRTLREDLLEAERELKRLEEEQGRQAKLADAELKRFEEALAAMRLAEQALGTERHKWLSWLDACHLPEDVSPDTALHLFGTVEQGMQAYHQIRRLREREDLLRSEQLELHDRVRSWVGDVTEDRLEVELHAKLTEAEVHVKRLEQCSRWKDQLDELDNELAEIADRLKQLDERLGALYKEAEVDSESSFRTKLNQWGQREELIERKRQIEILLEGLSGSIQREAMFTELSARGLGELEEAHTSVSQELASLLEELNTTRERKGSLRRELDHLESAEEPSLLALKMEEQQAAVRETAEDWGKRALALALIQATRRRMEREKQPAVLQKASGYFALMTGDRYSAVDADWEQRSLYAARADGERLLPSQLSRGTVEQMFVSIRFALAAEQSKRAPVPLLLDDIFVNFDPERMHAAWRAVAALAERHQVLMFTCHEGIVEAAKEQLTPDKLQVQALDRLAE